MIPRVAEVKKAMKQAASLYHRLVLITGPAKSGKTKTLRVVAEEGDSPLVNVNLRLSGKLLDLSPRQRKLQAAGLFREILKDAGKDKPGVVLLDNLELLFTPELELDPLRLLQHESRDLTLVASWPGAGHDDHLTYAEPGHPEYRQYAQPEALIVSMEEKTKSDAAPSKA